MTEDPLSPLTIGPVQIGIIVKTRSGVGQSTDCKSSQFTILVQVRLGVTLNNWNSSNSRLESALCVWVV